MLMWVFFCFIKFCSLQNHTRPSVEVVFGSVVPLLADTVSHQWAHCVASRRWPCICFWTSRECYSVASLKFHFYKASFFAVASTLHLISLLRPTDPPDAHPVNSTTETTDCCFPIFPFVYALNSLFSIFYSYFLKHHCLCWCSVLIEEKKGIFLTEMLQC